MKHGCGVRSRRPRHGARRREGLPDGGLSGDRVDAAYKKKSGREEVREGRSRGKKKSGEEEVRERRSQGKKKSGKEEARQKKMSEEDARERRSQKEEVGEGRIQGKLAPTPEKSNNSQCSQRLAPFRWTLNAAPSSTGGTAAAALARPARCEHARSSGAGGG
eukprot:gene14333-biopygen11320